MLYITFSLMAGAVVLATDDGTVKGVAFAVQLICLVVGVLTERNE